MKRMKIIKAPDEINDSLEIHGYTPNQELTVKDYQISSQLNDLELNFEKYCMAFLKKAKPDEFNSSYMDAVIECITADAVKLLRVQRADHVQTIMKPLNNVHTGDLIKCKSKLECFRRLKEENAKELALYRKIYRRGTSLEDEEAT